MTTPLVDVAARRAELANQPVLQRLSERLKAQLAPLLAKPLFVPEEKALLSRDGGVCPTDGARLTFRPLEPWKHQCPKCGNTYEGPRHHRWWITRYQIWLSERAIHCALLAGLTDDKALRTHAAGILSAYAAHYTQYPNQDNVLGPTRLFFSTYLESIWLSQIVLAASLLDADPAARTEAAAVRVALAPVVAESSGIIASFDEMFSNRQVWNNAALAAAGAWLDNDEMVDAALNGPHGVRTQLEGAVSNEGMWWEGENYHFFALRGFVLAAEALRQKGIDLYADADVGERFGLMFEAPLRALLPGYTLPARGDAPYGVSLLQPRFADLYEIGRARTQRSALDDVLMDLYDATVPERDDPGFDEMAEQEQNRPAQRLTRAMLGWKCLAWMNPDPPLAAPGSSATVSVWEDMGLAVLRPGPDRYASLECGPTVGGHGHPDVLHLSLVERNPRFADFGTASYVSPSLRWYRSTLAHNAPGIAGEGQRPGFGWCNAADHSGAWSWCRAFARGVLGEGTLAVRSVIVGPDYVADIVEVNVAPDAAIDLPIHPLGTLALDPSAPPVGWPVAGGSAGHEHGYDQTASVRLLTDPATPLVVRNGDEWRVVLAPRDDESVYAATAPAPPDISFADSPPLTFLVRHATGPGAWAQVYAGPGRVDAARFDGSRLEIDRSDGTQDALQLGPKGVRIETSKGTVKLSGLRREPQFPPEQEPPVGEAGVGAAVLAQLPAPGDWTHLRDVTVLGEQHYRRSETPYGAVPFSAKVALCCAGDKLGYAIEVQKPDLVVRLADAPDPQLDNESPDIHSDGVQVYASGPDGWWGFVVLPDLSGSGLRVRAVAGTSGSADRVSGSWARTESGYAMVVALSLDEPLVAGDELLINVVVNEMRPQRERRAGQLALSGGGWVYLRGDRESPTDAVVARVT